MPYGRSRNEDRRSSNNGRGNNQRRANGGGYSKRNGSSKKQSFSRSDYNMLNALTVFLDEGDGKYGETFKGRIMLRKNSDGSDAIIADQDGKGDEYTREEAVKLIAEALLDGAAINCYLFEKEDDRGRVFWSGNGRINIFNVLEKSSDSDDEEEEEEQPRRKSNVKSKAAKTTKSKVKPEVKYEIPSDDDDIEEETYSDEDEQGYEDEIPY